MRRNLPPRHRGSRCHLHAPIDAQALFPYPYCGAITTTALRRHCFPQALPLLAIALASGRPCRRQPYPQGCPLWPRSGQLPPTAMATAPCGLAASVAYARRRRPCRRQPCLRATVPAGGYPLRACCPCKGLWPWPATLILIAFTAKM
ncbi:hypothetical protein GW17_00050858 [Ensete ventricosum]|nr:hypothetical protein GW17_00050858 [Ensete ventricosum]RZS15029.1 hypothetical protein BHM03_00046808 [Ensete ventricosum]